MMWRWFWVGCALCWAKSFPSLLCTCCMCANRNCLPALFFGYYPSVQFGTSRSEVDCGAFVAWPKDCSAASMMHSLIQLNNPWVWHLGTPCSFVAKWSGLHVCSKLPSVISKPCPVAKAPLLAEYSFFGQMGVEQAVLMENDRRFWDSDLACHTISKL